MSAKINLSIKLGNLASLDIRGDNCQEISEALQGFETLNEQIETMCTDFIKRSPLKELEIVRAENLEPRKDLDFLKKPDRES